VGKPLGKHPSGLTVVTVFDGGRIRFPNVPHSKRLERF